MSQELHTPFNAILRFGQLLSLNPPDGVDAENTEHILKGGTVPALPQLAPGATDYLSKPFNVTGLSGRLDAALLAEDTPGKPA